MKSNIRASCVLSEILHHLRVMPEEPFSESLMAEFRAVMDKMMPHEEITVSVHIAKSKDSTVDEILRNVRPEQRKRVKHLCKLLYLRGYQCRRYSEASLVKKLERIIKRLEEK